MEAVALKFRPRHPITPLYYGSHIGQTLTLKYLRRSCLLQTSDAFPVLPIYLLRSCRRVHCNGLLLLA